MYEMIRTLATASPAHGTLVTSPGIMPNTEAWLVLGLLGIATSVVLIAMAVAYVIGMWTTLKRMGRRHGWAALIPFWREWELGEAAFDTHKKTVTLVVLEVVYAVLDYVTTYVAMGDTMTTIVAIALVGVGIATFVCWCMLCAAIAERFGKKGWFAVGLVFLPFAFFAATGLGDSPYTAPARATDDTPVDDHDTTEDASTPADTNDNVVIESEKPAETPADAPAPDEAPAPGEDE